jgi:hypothetical protein
MFSKTGFTFFLVLFDFTEVEVIYAKVKEEEGEFTEKEEDNTGTDEGK